AFSYRCKLMLVGPGGAGKTTLVARLMHGDFRPDLGATDGLGVHEWALPLPSPDQQRAAEADDGGKMSFSLWDFGGQDVYYSTHAFFMARRAVYLVLWRSRDDQELGGLREYLARIQALAPGAPMVLVGTNAGEKTEAGRGVYRPTQPPAALFADFPQLHPEAMFVSSKTGYGVGRLSEVLLAVAVAQPGTGERLPGYIVKLREEVRRARVLLAPGAEPLMPYDKYEAHGGFGEACGSADFGDLLHFSSVPGLEDAIVLRPQWVAEVMSRVVTVDDFKLRQLLVPGGAAGGGGGRVSKAALLKVRG
ncbi:putative serine/threonine-protein kinase, partial [Tetrabaena socialis]